MARHWTVVSTTLTLLALVSTGHAQTAMLVPGVRVRIAGPCLADPSTARAQCDPLVGRLRAWTPDSVVIEQTSGVSRTVPRGSITRIDVSDGVSSRKWLGAAVGVGVGLAVGLAGRCESDSGSQTLDEVGCEVVRMFYVPTTMFIGGTVGFLVGSLIRSEHWVTLPAAVEHVSIMPVGPSAIALSVTLRF